MNRQLMKVMIELIVFLGLSGDDVVNPDAAVAQLEAIANDLRALGPNDKTALVRFINEYADELSAAGDSSERAEFIREIPSSIGLELPSPPAS
jgi:hypothetical protein